MVWNRAAIPIVFQESGLSGVKAPRLNDHKLVHIINIGPLVIV